MNGCLYASKQFMRSKTNTPEVRIYVGGADVLYNKFNVTWKPRTYPVPPVHPAWNTNSPYSCVVETGGHWRLSRCTEEQHRVVCQSG